jgi:hypothetical protein
MKKGGRERERERERERDDERDLKVMPLMTISKRFHLFNVPPAPHITVSWDQGFNT